MRVHSITVTNVKGVRERTVTFPDRGVVVVEGPNEVGKSTILEAFDKLLDPRLKATSTSKEVRKLQPVGQDVGPRVAAEFTVGGQRVRYAKQWLRQASTTLEVLSPSPRQLSGEAAQAYVDRLVGGSLDRTLWDALRFAQSQDGTLAPLADSAVLSSALDAAAGAQLHVEEGEQVLELVAKEFATYYTRTGRPTGDYRRAMTAYTAAQDAVSEAHRRLQEAEELLRRQAEARGAAATATDEVEAARADHQVARRAEEAVAAVVEAHERARARLGEASEKSRSATQARQQRRQLVTAVTDLTERTTAAAATLAEEEKTAAVLVEALRRAEEASQGADDEVERAEAVCDVARADAEHLAEVVTLTGLEQVSSAVGGLVEQLVAARSALPQHQVTGRQLRDVEDLAATESRLRALHEIASAKVRVESLGEAVEVTTADAASRGGLSGDDASGDDVSGDDASSVRAGEHASYVLTEELVVTVPGAARVVIVPEQGSQARLAELTRAREALDRSLTDLGVASVGELAAAVAEQDAAREEVRRLEHEIEVALAGRPGAELAQALAGQVPTGLADQVARVRGRVEAYAQERSVDTDLPSDVVVAEGLARAATTALQQARAQRRRVMAELREQRDRAGALRSRLERESGRLEADRARLAELARTLEQERSRAADDVLEAQVQERSAALVAVEGEARRAQRAVQEADVDGIARRVVAAATRVDVAQLDCDRLTAALHTLTGQVELAASEGRRERYDLAVADLDHAERHLASLDRRARAARHLWRTLQAHRDAAHRAYVQPYTEALETLGRTVYGDGFSVTVDEQLTLATRTLDGTTVPFEELSGGAKEQLGILARLAVARLVDPTQGVPVVIDDALGYSDPERLQQMGQVLGASAGGSDVQVILLTCTPERYAAIPDVHTVRMAS